MTVDFARMYMRTMHIVARSTARVDDSLGIQLHHEDGHTGWAYCPIQRGANEREVAFWDATASGKPSFCNYNPRTALCKLGPKEAADYDHGTILHLVLMYILLNDRSTVLLWHDGERQIISLTATLHGAPSLYRLLSATSAAIPAHRPHFVHFSIYLASTSNNITANLHYLEGSSRDICARQAPPALWRVYCPSTIWQLESGVSPLHLPSSLRSLRVGPGEHRRCARTQQG
ncbi:hypothetical protein EDD17DRAFT_1507761 [Pisolithus thermaeus]|nr:hypothetical protein EV401DRAFT_1883123 [Pisolithus croceorrhizus]KAI6162912.1 hypothetical protein EDD17DRAFT_1507761 [Pisolithus thermaeus]